MVGAAVLACREHGCRRLQLGRGCEQQQMAHRLRSLLADCGLWDVIPNALAYWRKKDVPFTTLFFTLRSLERRLHAVAIVIAAGLAVLLIHLAVYPWPDLARESAGHAGLTPRKAREAAEAELQAKGAASLKFSTQQRGVVDGKNVLFMNRRPP